MSDPGVPTAVGSIKSGLGSTPSILYFSAIDSILLSIQPTPTITISISDPSTSTNLSSIPSTSDFPTPTFAIPSTISATSLSILSSHDSIATPTSTTSIGGNHTVTVVETQTAVLSTDAPHNTDFAHQTGAIIGIALAATFLLLLIVLLIFLAYRHRRSNHSDNSPMRGDILPVTRNPSWRSPLEGDDDENAMTAYDRSSMPFPNHPEFLRSQQGHDERPFGPSVFSSGSFDDVHDTESRPWWANTKPLNINNHNNPQRLPLTVNSAVSTSSLGLSRGSSSKRYHGSGSSGEGLLSRSNTIENSIARPKPVRKLRRKHHSTPPTALMLGRDDSLEYGTQQIQRHQEEHKTSSSLSLARLRRPKAYSPSTTIRSQDWASPSNISSPYPPIHMSQTIPLPYGSTSYFPNEMLNQHQGTSERISVTLPLPSPTPSTDTRSMIEGLLHPRLGMMALTQSQRGSIMSLRDHEDYTRPINGLVNNHVNSTTTFEVLDTVDTS